MDKTEREVKCETDEDKKQFGKFKKVPNVYYQDFELLFKAIDRLLLINIRRSKLLGLEVPPQTALLMAEYQKLFDQFNKLVSEVGGIIVKEAPPEISQRILAKIASFQAASAGATSNVMSAYNASGNGQMSETALNINQVNIYSQEEPRMRKVGPPLEPMDVTPGFEPTLPQTTGGDICAINLETTEQRESPEAPVEDEPIEP